MGLFKTDPNMDYKIYYRKKKGESTPQIVGKRFDRSKLKSLKKDDDNESTPFLDAAL